VWHKYGYIEHVLYLVGGDKQDFGEETHMCGTWVASSPEERTRPLNSNGSLVLPLPWLRPNNLIRVIDSSYQQAWKVWEHTGSNLGWNKSEGTLER
jgi:hypothetical protein